MMGYWGHPNGDIPLSAMTAVEGHYFQPGVAERVAWALAECRRRGVRISINEGYRAKGVPADQFVTIQSQTSTGGSNQWFQWGRYRRGLTPSAAWPPAGSTHGFGQAGDFDYASRHRATVVEVFALAGLRFTIPSESWHADASGTVLAPALLGPSVPILEPKEDPMLILRSKGDGDFANAGSMYRRDEKTGAWRELTNLEGNVLVPKLVANGAVLHDFDVNEIEIMFAVDGLVETHPVPEVTWGGKKTPLKGGGAPTGRVIFPGRPE